MLDEAIADSVHLRLRAEAALSDHRGGSALNEAKDDFATTTHAGVFRPHCQSSKLSPLALRKLLPRVNDLRSNQGGTPFHWCVGRHDLSAWSPSFN